jgi:hypothetical protein
MGEETTPSRLVRLDRWMSKHLVATFMGTAVVFVTIYFFKFSNLSHGWRDGTALSGGILIGLAAALSARQRRTRKPGQQESS